VVILDSLVARLFLDLGKATTFYIVAFELMSHSTRLTCSYAHRMQNTKGHAPIRDMLEAAGVVLPSKVHTKRSANRLMRRLSVRRNSTSNNERLRWNSLDTPAAGRASEQCWMDNRQKSLELLRERKSRRRGHGCTIRLYESTRSGVNGHSDEFPTDERFEDSTR